MGQVSHMHKNTFLSHNKVQQFFLYQRELYSVLHELIPSVFPVSILLKYEPQIWLQDTASNLYANLRENYRVLCPRSSSPPNPNDAVLFPSLFFFIHL